MQRKSFIALFLLAAFGFGLLAGAHPCGARQEGEQRQRSPSCHASMANMEAGMEEGHGVSVIPSVPSREEGTSGCCDTFCQHACHVTAIAAAVPVAFAIAPVAQAILEADDPGPALFVPPIDHIPLA